MKPRPYSEALNELASRLSDLEKLVCMLARADLAHEYGKDLYRAGPLAAFQKLGNDEDIPGAVIELRQSEA